MKWVCRIFAVLFFVLFIFSLLWFIAGSLEMMPTPEQQEKARIGAAVLMIIFAGLCGVSVITGIKNRK